MAPISDTDVKLMLAMIGSVEMIKTDNEKLAEIIGGGKTYIPTVAFVEPNHQDTTLINPKGTTANAIRQRVAKIKNQAKAVVDGSAVDITFGGSTTSKAKGTPKKAAAAGKKASVDDVDADEESAVATPAPKKRAANGKAKGTPRAKKTKNEDGGEIGDELGDESPAKRVKSDESGEV
ncbi:hypothetical protein E2P81_ATG06910 [Venturia nashicola]|nr:hypothetical protein E2P81_ATG06910 [Venturia nashicola]